MARVSAVIAILFCNAAVYAAEVHAAIAANFTAAINRLAPVFEKTSGHKLISSFGATGKLYAQIQNGAPFDVFLSADDETPKRLEQEGLGVAKTRFTYAIGHLALWSSHADFVDAKENILRKDFTHLAIANPKTAPYGAAAEQALRKLGLLEKLTPKLVYGENIAQTLQFISSGNAQLGFVALAQVHALSVEKTGSHWLVPPDLHEPLRQDAVLLKRAADNDATRAFLEFLRSPQARIIIEELGYTAPK